jgi:hypothetical protein
MSNPVQEIRRRLNDDNIVEFLIGLGLIPNQQSCALCAMVYQIRGCCRSKDRLVFYCTSCRRRSELKARTPFADSDLPLRDVLFIAFGFVSSMAYVICTAVSCRYSPYQNRAPDDHSDQFDSKVVFNVLSSTRVSTWAQQRALVHRNEEICSGVHASSSPGRLPSRGRTRPRRDNSWFRRRTVAAGLHGSDPTDLCSLKPRGLSTSGCRRI